MLHYIRLESDSIHREGGGLSRRDPGRDHARAPRHLVAALVAGSPCTACGRTY